MQQVREAIFNYMHENNLCHCPRAASFNAEQVPEGYTPKCVAEDHATALTDILQNSGNLK